MNGIYTTFKTLIDIGNGTTQSAATDKLISEH